MFDFGFSEMLVIGVIALVVLGPERLPVVARTAGEWVGKAQRFVAQVKSDIDRETELSELKRIQDEAKALADDVKSTVEKSAAQIESDVKSAAGEAKAVAEKTQDNLKEIEETASGQTTVMSNDEISTSTAGRQFGRSGRRTHVQVGGAQDLHEALSCGSVG